MALIRAFENTSRCMQRLGFVKYLASRCAASDISSLVSLGQGLVNTASQKVKVQPNPEVLLYIERRLTDRAYRDLKKSVSKTSEFINLEIQDVYLSSPELPSSTGKLVYDDWRRFPRFPSSLGLMRKGTYSSLVRGHVLLKLVSQEEVAAFKEYLPNCNPFRLDLKQKLLFLYQFLEHDGDILQPLYSQLLVWDSYFSDRDAGDLLPPIFRDLEKRTRARVRSGNEIVQLQQLLSIASNIEKWKGRPYTGKGAREESVTVRLEPLVDIGLLEKEDAFSYKYRLSSGGKAFFNRFTKSDDVDSFLSRYFFQTSNSGFDIEAEPSHDNEFILEQLYESYNCLKSPLGYAPLTDVALLAGITSIIDRKIYFEIEEAIALLKEFQKEHPEAIRFNIDRMGRLAYVKFNTPVLT